jgi:hypothetical protein
MPKPGRLHPDLIRAYKATDYHVEDPQGAFVLRVGDYSRPLERCQVRYRACSSVFITAWNPYGEQRPDEENRESQRRLIRQVDTLGLAWIPGFGAAPGSGWPREPSILVLGIDLAKSVALGKSYRQNAIVFCPETAVPGLEIIL